MQDATLLETHVQKPSAVYLVAAPMVVAIVCAVALGINLFIGESQLPRELVGSTPWFGAGLLLFSGVTFALWRRSRIRMTLIRKNDVRYLEIYDNSHPLVLMEPFEIAYGTNTVPMAKGPDATLILVGIYQEGELQVAFTETWGAIYAHPPGWPGPVTLQGTAKASYTASGRSFCVQLVDELTA